jgi:rubredoxin
MTKFRCIVCEYVYAPENGCLESGIEPVTLFEELPDDWVVHFVGQQRISLRRR